VALFPLVGMASEAPREVSYRADPVLVVAEAVDRLARCPSLDERRKEATSYLRAEVTPEGILARARLVDAASGAELGDACLRATLPDAAVPPAGPLISVWWPLAASTPRFGAPRRVQVPGVDLLVVPRRYPARMLPKDLTRARWLGLCGRKLARSVPRKVKLARRATDDSEAFDDVTAGSCGSKRRRAPVLRGAGLHGGDRPAHLDAKAHAGPVTIRFAHERSRVWQVRREGRPRVLALAAGATVQVLATDEDPEWGFAIAWAGDLDRDGRVDLVVRDGEPRLGRYRLFLSRAQHTLPVLLAAEVELPGD
jgi:hypothetical protein